MPLPLPLADAITTIITIVLMSLGALSAIANKLAEKQQANAAKARPRPQGGVQDEIEQFLREVTGDKNAQRNRGDQQNRPQQNRGQESRPQQGGGSAQPPARRRQSGQGAGNRQQREQRREQQRPPERSQEQPVQQEHVSLRERSERREARRRRAEATKQQNKPASQSSGSPSNKKPVVKVVREGQAPLRPVEQVGADQAFDKLVADVTTTSSAARLTTSVPTTTGRRGEPNLAMLAELRTPEAMRKAIIVSEMLQKPVAMRKSR